MERQYIGARYVPKFFENPNTGDSTWLAGVAYEALTIVTYSGNSYTSKKPVPAGVGAPNTAREYWVSTGIYNAQIEALQQAVELLTDKFPIETESLANGAVTPDKLSGRKFILLADSFGNTSTVGGNTWIQYFESILNLTEGETAFSRFSSSGGFVKAGTNGTYLQMLTNINTSGDIENNRDITDIVVETAGNDWEANQSQFTSALNTFCNYAHTNFPNAQVHIAYTSKFNTSPVSAQLPYFITNMTVLKDNQFRGYHFLTNVEYVMLNLTTVDGVHPNSEASQILAGHIVDAVLNGSTTVRYRRLITFTPSRVGSAPLEFTLTTLNNISCLIQGASATRQVMFNDSQNPITGYSHFNGIKLGSFSREDLAPYTHNRCPVFCVITDTNNNKYHVSGNIILVINQTDDVTDVKLETNYFNTDESAIQITKIEISAIQITRPTEELI